MSKTGRNAPCPCGSGKKLKKCCADARPASQPRGELASESRPSLASAEAEESAREELARFPERIDGHEYLAAVFEARGDHTAAAKHYRCAAAGMTPAEPSYDPAYVPYLLYRADVHTRLSLGVQVTHFDKLTDSVAGDLIRGDLDEAALQIEVLLLGAPDHHVVIERRGQLREIRGDRAGAACDFREAAALSRAHRVDAAHIDYLTTRAAWLDPSPPRA
jgi:tetratricopeptide (TPR) repeat protein